MYKIYLKNDILKKKVIETVIKIVISLIIDKEIKGIEESLELNVSIRRSLV